MVQGRGLGFSVFRSRRAQRIRSARGLFFCLAPPCSLGVRSITLIALHMKIEKTQFIRELKDKDNVSSPFLVKYAATATDKNGKAYMNVVLMDKTGEIEGRIWEDVARYASFVIRDGFIHVEGRIQLFQGRRQIVLNRIQALREDQVEVEEFLTPSAVDVGALYEKLLGYIASMKDPHYKALAESVLRDDAEIIEKFKRAPAAKSVHHAYPNGLLEHVVSVTGLLDGIGTHYGEKVNRDLLFIGGFFHDLCKIWELSYERSVDYTLEGKLIGHLVMGVELIDQKVRLLDATPGRLPSPFPREKLVLAKHMVLAHHGKLEYGSPKEPHCVEALIVHYVDDLDSKVNGILKFIEADQNPGEWTLLNKMFERYFYKPEWARI